MNKEQISDLQKYIFNSMEPQELMQMFNSLDKFYKNILLFKMED
ncbi:MAG: hypothetical protein RR636_14805 [Clostridium sp.]